MNLRKPLLVGKMNASTSQVEARAPKALYRFMIHYIGDHNPAIDRWADQLAEHHQGQKLGESYCRLSGERSMQYSFESRDQAQRARASFVDADLSSCGDHYELIVTRVTDKGWVYPPPTYPVSPPHA